MSIFGRAQKMWRGARPPERQYYHVSCPEGHRLRGERTESYQALRCPECGAGIFVLPRSPLPDPPAPAHRGPRTRPAAVAAPAVPEEHDEGPVALSDPPSLQPPPDIPAPAPAPAGHIDLEIDWLEPESEPSPGPTPTEAPAEPAPASTQPRPQRPKAPAPRPVLKAPAPRPETGFTPPAGVETTSRKVTLPARTSLMERIQRRKHALIFGGVLLLVVLTGLYQFRRWLRQDLPQVVERGRTEGLAALEAGQFDTAKTLLERAAAAADSLGGEIEGAQQVRDAAREAAIYTDQVSASLEEILDAAARTPPSEFQRKFRSLYQGQSIIVSDYLQETPDEKGVGRYVGWYRILVPFSPNPRIGRIDYTGFQLFEYTQPPKGERVVFGARLASLKFDEVNNIWLFGLEPRSGIRMSWAPLRNLGDTTPWDDEGPAPDTAAWLTPRALLSLLAVAFQGATRTPKQAPTIPTLEPSELTRKGHDGQEVWVDGRIREFVVDPQQGFHELLLQRTPVVFEIPARLRPRTQPSARTVWLRGTLHQRDDVWFCSIDYLELLPGDRERLDKAVAALPADDAKHRSDWARWAERRGALYKDPELTRRAAELELQAFRIEAEHPGADPVAHWLALAERGRKRKLPEPEPEALAHRGFRARLQVARSAADLKALLAQVQGFFPDGADPPDEAKEVDLTQWAASYAGDPAGIYRKAPEPVREALDRRLWADVYQRWLEARTQEDPKEALDLVEEARAKLPDRPEVSQRLLAQGTDTAFRDPGALTENEVGEVVDLLRKHGQKDRAADLRRSWLDNRRKEELPPNDVDSRLILADKYVYYLGDRAVAGQLLREALALAPSSTKVLEAFRRLGFREINGEWVGPKGSGTSGDQPPPPRPPRRGVAVGSLVGMTRSQVQSTMGGKPDHVIRVATQGQVLEQWIYANGARGTQYINFQHHGAAPTTVVDSFLVK